MANLNLFEILKMIWAGLMVISFVVAVFSFLWGFFDIPSLVRYEGEIKRGFKIWSKPLSDDFRRYLLSLSQEVIETRKTLFSERKSAFIRIENQEALIYSRRLNWSTSWPYVGYVDLSEPDPVLEFRSSLPMHLFLMPFVFSISLIPFVVIIMLINYYMESTAIENFIKRKILENIK
jgi:hypothetical protein